MERTYSINLRTITSAGIEHKRVLTVTAKRGTRQATVLKRAALSLGFNLDPIIYWHGPVLCGSISGSQNTRIELLEVL